MKELFVKQQNLRTGTEISKDLIKLTYNEEREEFILNAFFDGHIPNRSRSFTRIKIPFTGSESRRTLVAEIDVLNEYISLGTDDDYIRCPLNPHTAQTIADGTGCMLPTTGIVDAIWKNADIKLKPNPWGPPYDSSMMSSDRLIKHSRRIDNELKGLGVLPSSNVLIVGHKKDVIIHNVLTRKKGKNKVAIYGWHQLNGTPIQGLYGPENEPYVGHEDTYKDYSHGIRLVHREIIIDDATYDLADAVISSEFWPAFGLEPLIIVRQPSHSK